MKRKKSLLESNKCKPLYSSFLFLFIILFTFSKPAQSQELESYTYKLTQSTEDYDIWTTLPSERVFKDLAVPETTGSEVKVYAAKNEFEPFQVIVNPESSGNVTVSAGDFGSDIEVEIYQVKYVNITQTTDNLGRLGDYPDPLWPVQNGESVPLTAGENTSFWFSLYVPKTVESGDYTANVTIGGVDIPVTLHVFNFQIPDEVHVKSQMNFSHNAVLDKYGVQGTGDDYWFYVDKMKQYFIDHRLTPKSALWSGGLTSSGGAPYIDYDCGTHTFSDPHGIWGFEQPADKYLNGNGFNDGTGFPSFMCATFRNNDASNDQRPDEFCGIARTADDWYTADNPSSAYNTAWFDYMTAMQDYLSSLGYLDKAYYYFANEPQDQADYDAVAWYAEQLKSAAPDLKLMVSEEPKPEIYNHPDYPNAKIDIWLPVLNNYTPDISHDRAKNHNEDSWVYFLHGTRPPYFNPITLDHPGIESKFTGWLLWKYRLRGIAYYSMNNWSQNPWTNPMNSNHNGDLFMLYPPSQDNNPIAYGSNNHRFVPSIRFELMRESLEDYEYLYVLNGGNQPEVDVTNSADYHADKIISGLTAYTRDSEFMYNLRRYIGLKNGGEISEIPDIHPRSIHPRAEGEPGNYYVNFQDPQGEPLDDPLIVDEKEYMKIGWNTYDEELGYGWYGDMAHVAYQYLSDGPNELQKSIIYDDWGREKTFEFALPNGTYNITVSIGWEGRNSSGDESRIVVEGITFFDGDVPDGYMVKTLEVTIEDNLLTMDMGIFDRYTMLNYIDVEAIQSEEAELLVSPDVQELPATGGITTFEVSNAGGGTMNWTASHSTDWLTFESGESGTDNGIITLNAGENTGMQRMAQLTITADGALNSPAIVEIHQQAGIELPTVITENIQNILSNSADCMANVTSGGGAPVTAKGVCWSTNPQPAIADALTNEGTGTGHFATNITGLDKGITYYVRAYATNEGGTAYGAQLKFTTRLCDLALNPVNMSEPDAVIGDGTPESITVADIQNALNNGGKITFNTGGVPAVISITHEFTVNATAVIDGKGLITIDAGHNSRIFLVDGDIDFTVQNMTLLNGKAPAGGTHFSDECGGAILAKNDRSLTIINTHFENNMTGNVDGSDIAGGAVYAFGVPVTSVSGCTFVNNRASNGGAIGDLGGDLVLAECEFSGCQATGTSGGLRGQGGAIYIDGVDMYGVNNLFDVCGCKFIENAADEQGGAINSVFTDNTQSKAKFDLCSFENNHLLSTERGQGGAVFHMEDEHTTGGETENNFEILNSTFAGNLSYGQGGAVWTLINGNVDIQNCTFNQNRATSETGQGGAMAVSQGIVNINNCTFAGNHAGYQAGGIHGGAAADDRVITLKNTIFSNNTCNYQTGEGGDENAYPSTKWQGYQTNRTFTDGGSNLQFPENRPEWNTTDVKITETVEIQDPKLLPLENNGGITKTMALKAQSPAIDAGSGCTPTDQRGAERFGICDIGAFEYSGTLRNAPEVKTLAVADVSSSGAVIEAEVVSPGGSQITERGVCWSLNPDPTIIDAHTNNGSGMGMFTAEIVNLPPNTTYHVRAFATNESGTAYGEDLTFTTTQSCNCGPLPEPNPEQEEIVTVNTINDLQNEIDIATGKKTIYLETGTYHVTSTSFVNVVNPDITIRSVTGNPEDVIIKGQGMGAAGMGHGIMINESNITIADITIRDVQNHAIIVQPYNAPSNLLFHNIRCIDAGEQLFKGSGTINEPKKHNGIIECSVFEYTTTLDQGNYTNGIDILNCHDWVIRDNLIKNIKAAPGAGLAGPAILVWHGSSNTIVERNTILNSDFGISFGNSSQEGISHTGGIIRNNFIKGHSNSDFGIGIVKSPDAKVINNTVYSPEGWPHSIEARFPETVNCLIMNNLTDENIWSNRDGASATLVTNIYNAETAYFVDAGNGDLHLAPAATDAINAGTNTADRTSDIDCEDIADQQPDIGADEFLQEVDKPVLSVSPIEKEVAARFETFVIEVKNTGTGDMNWTAQTDAEWITLNPLEGINNGTITVEVNENTGELRNAIVLITAEGAENSPIEVNITQKSAVQPILTVTPSLQNIGMNGGDVSFTVSNTGGGSMIWTASTNEKWFTISNGESGTDEGIITVQVDANDSGDERIGEITVVSEGAFNSPMTIQIQQLAEQYYNGPVWHVSPNGSDETGDGSEFAPFATIQYAIDLANNGTDTVLVHEGHFVENIDFRGKNIVVTSAQGAQNTIIDGNNTGRVVTIISNGNDEDAELSGFTITGGYLDGCYPEGIGGGIYCENSRILLKDLIIENNYAEYSGGGIWVKESHQTLYHVVIRNNSSDYGGGASFNFGSDTYLKNVLFYGNSASIYGGAIDCYDGSNPLLENLTIDQNTASQYGGAICVRKNSNPTLWNSILFDNSPDEISFYDYEAPSSITVGYSDIKGGETAIGNQENGTVSWSEGNINQNPQYINGAAHDYHLETGSPCVNAGDPASDYSLEPEHNGSRINMGFYGNTPEAAHSQVDPILSVTPSKQYVEIPAGTTTFDVTNEGINPLIWVAETNADWLTIESGDAGVDDGTITVAYTENTGLERKATLTITADEAIGSPKVVKIIQSGPNQPPVIVGQSELSTEEEKPLTIKLRHLTVEDPDNVYPNDFTLTVMEGENYTIDGNSITPVQGFVGELTVPVVVNDGEDDSNTFDLIVTVTEFNDPPVIVSQLNELTTPEETELIISVNDVEIDDPDNAYPNDFTIKIINGDNYSGTNNTLVPAKDFVGDLSVGVKVSDGEKWSEVFYLTVTVTNVNDPPVIVGQNPLSTDMDTPLEIVLNDLIVEDVDDVYPSGFSLTVKQGTGYTVDGATITPEAGFYGTIKVPVFVNDGTDDSNTFHLTIEVINTNDVPEITGQKPLTTPEETPLEIILADLIVEDDNNTYPDDFTLTVKSGTNYTFTGNIITPKKDFNGNLFVLVYVNDGMDNSNVFELKVNVTPVNDAPVITGQQNLFTLEETAFTVEFNHLKVDDVDDIYPNGFTLTVQQGDYYTLDGNTLTPQAGFTGTLIIPVMVNDGVDDSNVFDLNIEVKNVNTVPEIVGQEPLTTPEETPLEITLQDLVIEDDDNTYPGDYQLTVKNGENYTVSGNIITPVKDFVGGLTVPVFVNDGIDNSNVFDLAVTVNNLNDPPVIKGQEVLRTPMETAIEITFADLDVTDVDDEYPNGFALTVKQGENYTLNGNSVMPVAGFVGNLAVPVFVNDGVDNSNTFYVTIEVYNDNDIPEIVGQVTLETEEETPVEITLSDIDVSDDDNVFPDDFVLTVLDGENYFHDGNTVTPRKDFVGYLFVKIFVNDGRDVSEIFDLKVNVTDVNDAPVIIEQAVGLSALQGEVFEIKFNQLVVEDVDDIYPNGFTMLIGEGEGFIVSENTILIDPAYSGELLVPVTVNDGTDDSNTFELLINVKETNSIPVITGQNDITTPEDTPFEITLEDLIVEDEDNSYPSDFTLTVFEGENYMLDGNLLIPDENFNGDLLAPVVVNDGLDNSNTFEAIVNVTPVNDPPAITGQNELVTMEETPIQISLADITIEDADDNAGSDYVLVVMPGENYDFEQTESGAVITPTYDFTGALEVMITLANGELQSEEYPLLITVENVNDPPEIVGQLPVSTLLETPVEITPGDLVVLDSDNAYPTDFSLTVLSGENYQVSGTTVTPDNQFTGYLLVPVYVSDLESNSNTFNLEVLVKDSNVAPVITGQNELTTEEDTPLTLSLLDLIVDDPDNVYPNDFALFILEGDNYTFEGNTIIPAENYIGQLYVPVKVSDGINQSEVFEVLITVTPVNDPPVITEQATLLETDEETPFDITFDDIIVVDEDSDYPTDFTLFVLGGENYSVTGKTVTPAEGFTGELFISVMVNDGQSNSNMFVLVANVMNVNDIPEIVGQYEVSTIENTPVTITLDDLKVIDSDNNYPSDFTMNVLSGDNYSFDIAENGFVITPNDGFTGELIVKVFVNDGTDNSPVFDFAIAVEKANSKPVIIAQNPLLTTLEDTEIEINFDDLIVEDEDDSYPSDFTIHGLEGENYSLEQNGTYLLVTPAPDFFGEITAGVFVNDGTDDSEVFDVVIPVESVNDAPVIASQSVIKTIVDIPVEIQFDDIEVIDVDNDYPSDFTMTLYDGDNYSFDDVTVTPSTGFTGILTVNISVNDGEVESDIYGLIVEVKPTNSPPEIVGQETVSTPEETPLEIVPEHLIVVDSDDSYPSDFNLMVYEGENYTLEGKTITPDIDFVGILTVDVMVNDGLDDSNIFGLLVEVTDVNDAPVITGQEPLSVYEDTELELLLSDVIYTDIDSDVSSDFSLKVMGGKNYTFTGNTILPNADFIGILTVNVVVSDGQAFSEPYGLIVEVINVNDPPQITGQQPLSTPEETPLEISLADVIFVDEDAHDPSDFSLTVEEGAHFTLDGFTLTPELDFTGILTMNVMVSDGIDSSEPFVLHVEVTNVNDPPVITGQMPLSTEMETPLEITLADVTVEDIDSDYPSDFTLTVDAGNHYEVMNNEITPEPEFLGLLTVNVFVNDGFDDSYVFALSVSVTPIQLEILSQPESQVGCLGSSVSFAVEAKGTPPVEYQWLKNNEEMADATQSVFTLDAVTETDAGQYACIVSTPVTGEILTTNIADLIINDIQVEMNIVGEGCSGDNAGSVELVSLVDTANYQYAIDGGAYQESGLFTGLTAGTYTVSVKDVDYGCTEHYDAEVEEGRGDPIADFDYTIEESPGVQFINLSENTDSVFWDFDDGVTTDIFEPGHVYDNAGSYNVKLEAHNECGSDEITKTIEIDELAIGDLTGIGSLNVKMYPNPVKDVLTVQYENETVIGELKWRIMTVKGDVVEQRTLTIDDTKYEHRIRLSEYRAGMYIIEFVAGQSIQQKPLIILSE